jgi:hypothetical protein
LTNVGEPIIFPVDHGTTTRKIGAESLRAKMGKEISVYKLADGVTDEQYLEYVKEVKGPFLESLPSVRKFELVRIKGAVTGSLLTPMSVSCTWTIWMNSTRETSHLSNSRRF